MCLLSPKGRAERVGADFKEAKRLRVEAEKLVDGVLCSCRPVAEEHQDEELGRTKREREETIKEVKALLLEAGDTITRPETSQSLVSGPAGMEYLPAAPRCPIQGPEDVDGDRSSLEACSGSAEGGGNSTQRPYKRRLLNTAVLFLQLQEAVRSQMKEKELRDQKERALSLEIAKRNPLKHS
mmetsp:Transcript_21/g.25  ORF Transcript_21/g.25 Transcript_21/m.25 type:complete len:182 (+) Transcript_21:49-594(+)